MYLRYFSKCRYLINLNYMNIYVTMITTIDTFYIQFGNFGRMMLID